MPINCVLVLSLMCRSVALHLMAGNVRRSQLLHWLTIQLWVLSGKPKLSVIVNEDTIVSIQKKSDA